MVSVNDPYEIKTSTIESSYFGIFNGCDVSQQRVLEADPNFVPQRGSIAPGIKPYKSALVDYFEDDLDQQQQLAEAPAVEEDADKELVDKFASVLVSANEQIGEKKAAVDATEDRRAKFVADVEAEAKRSAESAAKKKHASMDVYSQLMSNDTSATDTADNTKLKYDQFKAFMAKYEKAIAESEEGSSDGIAKDDLEKARQVDRALDNQALNNGITDISGFGATENTSTMTNEQKAKAQAKRAREAARQADIAADNQALNRGETDIAGQGAGNSTPKRQSDAKRAGADMLRSLLGSKPTAPSQTDNDSHNYL